MRKPLPHSKLQKTNSVPVFTEFAELLKDECGQQNLPNRQRLGNHRSLPCLPDTFVRNARRPKSASQLSPGCLSAAQRNDGPFVGCAGHG